MIKTQGMNNLLFDIECCDGYHICSFGYVIFDNNFKIIKKKDILINPNKKFKLAGKDQEPRIQLAYEESRFRTAEIFIAHYKKIKELLENHRLFAHSATSDIMYLNIACERYSLPVYDLEVLDTQRMFAKDFPGKKQGLESIVSELQIQVDENATYHKSCDDAEISMLVLKELVKRSETDFETYLKEHHFINRTFESYRTRVESSRNIFIYTKELTKDDTANTKRIPIQIAENMGLSEREYKSFIQQIYAKNYRICFNLSKIKYFIQSNEDSGRGKIVSKLNEGKAKIKIIKLDSLSKVINSQNNGLECLFQPKNFKKRILT